MSKRLRVARVVNRAALLLTVLTATALSAGAGAGPAHGLAALAAEDANSAPADVFVATTPPEVTRRKMTLTASASVGSDASADDVIRAAFPEAGSERPPEASGDAPAVLDALPPSHSAKLDMQLLSLLLRTHAHRAGADGGAVLAAMNSSRPALGPSSDGMPAGWLPLAPLTSRTQPVRVLVETNDLAAATRAGLVVRSAADGHVAGVVPAGRLDDLAALPTVLRISSPKLWQLQNDLGRKDARVPQAFADYGVSGEGTVVAVLDSGIDFPHPSFRNPDGSTRVAGMLDLAFPGDVDADGILDGTVAGGTAYTREQIDEALDSGNGWESRAVNGSVAAGETERFNFDLDYRDPVSSLHTQLHIQADLGAARIALEDPEGNVIPIDLAADPTSELQATYWITTPPRARVDGIWSLVIENSSADEAYVMGWAFFVDRTVFMEDLNGHGTHVIGTAAGNGRIDGGPSFFAGVAPDADIVFVRGERDLAGFASDDVIAGIQWVDQTASTLGKPYALNLSIGGAIGPHDGTEPEDKAIDAMFGRGRRGKAIAVANGNEGDAAMHASGLLGRSSGVIPFLIEAPPDVDGLSYSWVYLAVEGAGMPTFGLVTPFPDELSCLTYQFNSEGEGVNPLSDCGAMSRLQPGTSVMFELLDADGVSATVGTVYWERGERAHLISVQWFETEAYWIMTGDWGLSVAGLSGRWDGWQPDCMPLVDCDNRMTVGSPASAVQAISVGAHNTRIRWVDDRGLSHNVDEPLGELASFSSLGPTRDGRMKPDVTAPGQKIISARSADRQLCPYVNRLYCESDELGLDGDISDELLALQGTSMATPMVTGAIALLLQLNPWLDGADVKEILGATARQDAGTGPDPDPDLWGAGKLDVLAAAQSVDVNTNLFVRVYLPSVKKRAPVQ